MPCRFSHRPFVQVDYFGDAQAFRQNVDIEMQRNAERYLFLKWDKNLLIIFTW